MSWKAASSSPAFLSPWRMGNQARHGEAVREGWHTQRPMNSSAPWRLKMHGQGFQTAFFLMSQKLRDRRSRMCPNRRAPPRRWAAWPTWPLGRRKSPPRRRWASGPRWDWGCYVQSRFSETGGGTRRWRRGLERERRRPLSTSGTPQSSNIIFVDARLSGATTADLLQQMPLY